MSVRQHPDLLGNPRGLRHRRSGSTAPGYKANDRLIMGKAIADSCDSNCGASIAITIRDLFGAALTILCEVQYADVHRRSFICEYDRP